MKRHLLSLVILMTISIAGQSQSLVISDANGNIPPFGEITVFGYPSANTIIAHLNCTNSSSDTIMVKVKKHEIELVQYTSNTFCWLQCYPPTTYVSPDAIQMNPGMMLSIFEGDYYPMGIEGTSKIAYVFFNDKNPDDSVMVTVNFNANTAGIEDLMARGLLRISQAYPNPASSQFSIEVVIPDKIGSGRLVLSNILGSAVREASLTGGSGRVIMDVSDLDEGVYFYTVMFDNQAAVMRKLIISR